MFALFGPLHPITKLIKNQETTVRYIICASGKRKVKKERREGLVERETEGRKETAEEGKKRGFSGERDRREDRDS